MIETVDNLRAAGLGAADVALYEHPGEHLRDEVYRVWLAAEAELRRRWERGTLRREVTGAGHASAEEIDAALAEVHADYGNRDPRAAGLDARAARRALLRRTAQVDARAEASLAAGRRLPLHELGGRLALEPDHRRLLAAVAAPVLDPRLVPVARLLAGDPAAVGMSRAALLALSASEPIARARLAAQLAPGSRLFDLGLVSEGEGGEPVATPRTLAFLAGAAGIDPTLAAFAELRPRAAPGQFPPGLVDRAARALAARAPLCLVVGGPAGAGKLLLVEEAAARTGRRVIAVDGGAVRGLDPAARDGVLAGAARDALLAPAVLAVRAADPAIARALIARVRAPVALVSPVAAPRWPAPVVPLVVPPAGPAERAAIWRREVPELDDEGAGGLARRYAASGATIAQIAAAVRAMGSIGLDELVAELELRVGLAPPPGAPPRGRSPPRSTLPLHFDRRPRRFL